MDIQPISNVCVKITVTEKEAAELGISFDSFEKENAETKAFLTYTLTILKETGVITLDSSSISVEVYEQEDKSLIIYISSQNARNTSDKIIQLTLFENFPQNFFDKIPPIINSVGEKISASELFWYNEKYFLIIKLKCSKTFLRKNLPKASGMISNPIKTEKIREYGKLLSDSPIELFI